MSTHNLHSIDRIVMSESKDSEEYNLKEVLTIRFDDFYGPFHQRAGRYVRDGFPVSTSDVLMWSDEDANVDAEIKTRNTTIQGAATLMHQ
jgi:hypothetical protein